MAGQNPTGDVLAELLGTSIKRGLGGGRSVASSSNSSANVSVNPAISIVTNGGSSSPNTSGYASGSPSSRATATPMASGGFGYGNPDSTIWPAQNLPPVSDGVLTDEIMGFPIWGWAAVVIAGGIYAFTMQGGKGRK